MAKTTERRTWCYAKLLLFFNRAGTPKERQALLKFRWYMWADGQREKNKHNEPQN